MAIEFSTSAIGQAAVMMAMFACYVLAYRHDPAHYRKGKTIPIPAPRGFGALFRLVLILPFAAAFLGAFGQFRLILSPFAVPPLQQWVGLALAAAGCVLFIAAKRSLGVAYSPCFDALVPTQLVSSDPYRYVRHPIYSANVLCAAGLLVATCSPVVLICLSALAAYYIPSAAAEERAMAAHLPGYTEYQRRTGRFLPRLVPGRALANEDSARPASTGGRADEQR